ncbi:isoprenoid synthase domain-containing protein [Phyllosticta citribraziliensis]|uniref:Terpene synthase n=1 Tax=Phyllosticta citribraziliensis TaxID=989973 RepID=A0ABR1L569_9PEZI
MLLATDEPGLSISFTALGRSSTLPGRPFKTAKPKRPARQTVRLIKKETTKEAANMAILPDLLVSFIAPEPKVNPHYEQVRKESEEWMRANLWQSLSEKDIKRRCAADFCYFSAILCPDVGKEELRTVCDWIYWVFEFDDQFDEGELGIDREKGRAEVAGMVAVLVPQGCSTPVVRRRSALGPWSTSPIETTSGELEEALSSDEDNQKMNPEFEREAKNSAAVASTPLQQLFHSIWERVGTSTCDDARERYVKSNIHFCRSVAELHGEEFDDMVVMENITRYLHIRAQNIGLYPLLSLEEYACGLRLPQAVFECKAIRDIERLVAEMLTLQNDILSYHREHSVGHSQNLISIFRRRLGLSQQQSYDKANELLHGCYRQWYISHSEIPSWGEKVDAQVQQYLQGCLNVLKANVRWSFKSQRYFGKEVDRVRETRQVVLVP